MALVTLQMIFQDVFSAYEQTHPLPAHVRKAARAIMQCRTAALGGHVQACPDGHVSRIWYNSCRHRACPQCASLQTERWLALQQARLLACDHYHVIFTLPHDLNPRWLANVSVMTSRLFQAVRETLCTLLADPKYLGAQPGIIAALHPWSQTLVLHPHLHCLVTGGGLTPAGQWVTVRNGFLQRPLLHLCAMMVCSHRFSWYKTQKELVMPNVDPNAVILTGENPFIRLSATDGSPNTTEASFWRITFSPGGPGHVLYLKSELTEGQLRIYSDNIAMTRWLQSTVQGMLNAATADLSIPVIDAVFSKSGDTRDYWTERLQAGPDAIALTWYNIGEPLLVHTQPHDPPERRYGVCTILMPALGARLTVNGRQASGQAWPRDREGRPFSTCALAFSESWTAGR